MVLTSERTGTEFKICRPTTLLPRMSEAAPRSTIGIEKVLEARIRVEFLDHLAKAEEDISLALP
jgi:hypothetical protein